VPHSPWPAPEATVSRRGLLLGGVGLLALAGCSGDDSGGDSGDSGDSGIGKNPPRDTSELAPDVAVATAALERIRATRAAVDATSTRHPVLGRELADVTEMHAAHEESLVDAVPERARPDSPPATYTVPPRRRVAARRLAVAETELHAALDELALRAESGDFARLLASMGAGIAQQLAGWPQ
jgi:hypothetical protein